MKKTHLSVARLSFAMDVRSSVLPALLFMPLILVMGVLAPVTDPAGVDVDVSTSPFIVEFFFAAFSARRFCFEAEGGIVVPRISLKFESNR